MPCTARCSRRWRSSPNAPAGEPSRRDAFWKLALVGGVVTSTVFVVAGSAPSGAAVRLSPQGAIAPALDSDGVFWLATGWMAITALLALRAGRAWRLGISHIGR